MDINVKSFAHLRLALGKSPVTMQVPEDTTVVDLINILIDQHGAAAREAIWKKDGQELKVTPVYEGKVIPLEARLRDGMTIVFMSIVAAG
jgi:molybdopterin converting factor small subunit